ncbi:MAG: TIGR03905 family TSCPD domain-containing protein [Desulfobacterales bacterium]|jgi:uncharacterized protein (TIGR03905 family)
MKNHSERKRFVFHTKGVCPPEIHFNIDDGNIKDIRFVGGGCPGNAQLVARLLEGKPLKEAFQCLIGIDCRNGTSCPDQLASAIEAIRDGSLHPADSFRIHRDITPRKKIGLIGELQGNCAALEQILSDIHDIGVEVNYCLGNLTGNSPRNRELLKTIRKQNIVTIQGENDWRYAQGKEGSGMPALDPQDRDWLVRLGHVLCFQMRNKKGIAFFGDYIQNLPDYSDFEPFALEMNMVCGLTNFMQDETVFPALEAMIPQFETDIILFGQIKKWEHRQVAGKDFISIGPARGSHGLNWGLLEINDDMLTFNVMETRP